MYFNDNFHDLVVVYYNTTEGRALINDLGISSPEHKKKKEGER